MIEVIKIGIAELSFVKSNQLIRTTGLGSCVGVVIYDEQKSIAGMAHVMLPDSRLAITEEVSMAKYADTGVKALIDGLTKMGACNRLLKAKITGGAQMFQFMSSSEIIRIGPRNVEAVKYNLEAYGVRIIAEDVGGNKGRTIEFNPNNCQLTIRTVNQGVMII